MDVKFIRVRKALVNNGTQLDVITIAQESGQSGLDKDRFRNFKSCAGISAKSALLRPPQGNDPVSRQVIGSGKLKRRISLIVRFKSARPKCQCREFFAHIDNIPYFLFTAVADDEPFMGKILASNRLLERIKGFITLYSESALVIECTD